MIKFFRSLRNKTISQSRFGKYLLYAIGEIILVVIGILIALQINNWNEHRKQKQFEVTILKNIKEDMIMDTLDLAFNLRYHKQFYIQEKRFLDFLLSDSLTPDQNIDFTQVLGIQIIVSLHKASYNNLQNNDAGIISNNILYKKITRFYDYYINSIIMVENDIASLNRYDEKLSYFKKHFRIKNEKKFEEDSSHQSIDIYNLDMTRYSYEIRNESELKSDEAFKVAMAENIFIRSLKISQYTEVLEKFNALNNAIEDEIQRLE